jgi:hypothetical protein
VPKGNNRTYRKGKTIRVQRDQLLQRVLQRILSEKEYYSTQQIRRLRSSFARERKLERRKKNPTASRIKGVK